MHAIFQRHHIPPHEVYAMDRRHRLFLFASELVAIEDADRARKEAERR